MTTNIFVRAIFPICQITELRSARIRLGHNRKRRLSLLDNAAVAVHEHRLHGSTTGAFGTRIHTLATPASRNKSEMRDTR